MDYNFTDVKFLTARAKKLILKSWISFLKSGLKREKFTKRLYEHLHLHCGFIAHYDINGFYETYFNGDYEDKQRFFTNFEGDGYHYTDEYTDINQAMASEYKAVKNIVFEDAQKQSDQRFEVLKACFKRAETDLIFRNSLLNRVLGN